MCFIYYTFHKIEILKLNFKDIIIKIFMDIFHFKTHK